LGFEDVLNHIMQRGNYEISAFQKPDEKRPKKRLVANPGPRSFYQMMYILWLFKDIFDLNTITTLFNTVEQRIANLNDIGQDMIFLNKFGCPIDLGDFDTNVPLGGLAIIVKWMCDSILNIYQMNLDARRNIKHICQNIIFGIMNSYLVVNYFSLPESNVKTRLKSMFGKRIEKGLASGFAITAVLGTLVGYCFAKDVHWSLKITLFRPLFQGDDASLLLANTQQFSRILDKYSELGLKINVKKNDLSKVRTEYLRNIIVDRNSNVRLPQYMLYSQNRVAIFGYANRLIASLCFYSPGSDRNVNPGVKMDALLSQCFLLINRGMDVYKVIDWFLRNVSFELNITSEQAKILMISPKIVGGFGWINHAYEKPLYYIGLEYIPLDSDVNLKMINAKGIEQIETNYDVKLDNQTLIDKLGLSNRLNVIVHEIDIPNTWDSAVRNMDYSIPLVPQYNEEYKQIVITSQLVVSAFRSGTSIASIIDKFYEQGTLAQYNVIKRRYKKNFANKWLMNRLPFPPLGS
jgi:hypothetical protein